jgi:hypothetical protein
VEVSGAAGYILDMREVQIGHEGGVIRSGGMGGIRTCTVILVWPRIRAGQVEARMASLLAAAFVKPRRGLRCRRFVVGEVPFTSLSQFVLLDSRARKLS